MDRLFPPLHQSTCPSVAEIGRSDRAFLYGLFFFAAVAGLAASLLAAPPRVEFDVAPVVVCRDVSPPEFVAQNPQEKLIEARFTISNLVTQGSEADLIQQFYRLHSPGPLRVYDFLPRTTLAAGIDGTIDVVESTERTAKLGGTLSGAFEHLLKAAVEADVGRKTTRSQTYSRLPPLESVAASGTLDRATTVYFKLKRTPRTPLEGSHEFIVMFRAPVGWRAGYLVADCRAAGWRRGPIRSLDEQAECGGGRFTVALYQEGDPVARQAAHRIRSGRARAARRRRIDSHPGPQAAAARRRRVRSGAGADRRRVRRRLDRRARLRKRRSPAATAGRR